LKRFYFTGPCSVEGGHQRTGEGNFGALQGTGPLALEQFLSAFFLLAIGIALAAIFLFVERYYNDFIHKHYSDQPPGCVALISQVSTIYRLIFWSVDFQVIFLYSVYKSHL